MGERRHHFRTRLRWLGNEGRGTASYTAYGRAYELAADGKPAIPGSSDAAFRGDAARWNPEDLLVASLSACHQLWYLHLCATAGVIVTAYTDDAEGVMVEQADGAGQFERIVLRPRVTLAAGSDATRALALHDEASRMCFVERTLRCEVAHEATIEVERTHP